MPCVPDRGQDVQLVVIFVFGNFPERRAKSPLMDACHLADGIARNGNQERIVFSCSQFFQCFTVSIVVMHSVGHGCDTTAVETVRVDDKFQVLVFHESDILKVQHSFGCRQGIRGQLALPCLVFGGPSETGGFKLFPLGVFRNPVEKNLQSVFPVVPDQ